MFQPLDYPVKEPLDSSNSGEMTYATIKDRHASRQIITDDMIQSACSSMEAAHQMPDATRPTPVKEPQSDAVLTRLLSAIR